MRTLHWGSKRVWLVLAALGLLLGLAACGSEDPTPTPVPPTATPTPMPAPEPGATAEPAPAPDPTPTPDTSFEAQWEQLVADAQAEGEIVISLGGTDSRHIRDTLAEFQKKFDIRVIASTGSGNANTTRILAERSRGRYTVDYSVAGTSSTQRLIDAEALVPVEPLIIEPTILNRTPEHWHLSPKVWWSDVSATYSMSDQLSIQNFEDIWYSTERLTPAEAAEITSWWDLADPKWAGEIAMTGFATQGTGATARVRIHRGVGREFWEAVTRNAAVGNNVLDFSAADGCADLVARAVVTFAVGCDVALRPLAASGLPVASITDDIIMEEGLSAEVGGTGTVLDRAPHPKAAQLFLNWWYSQDGMETDINFTRNLSPSPKLRSDVSQGKVPDTLWNRVGQLQDLLDEGKVFVVDQGVPEYDDDRTLSLQYLQALYDELGILYTAN